MRFTLMFPMRAVKHYDTWIGDGDLGQVARVAEDAGFDGVAMSEHPYPADDWLSKGGHHAFDPFVALAVMAAATHRVRLISYVLVASYRHPFLTAKALATLDLLSSGRVIAGMAVGYLESEFDVLGADFRRRGRYLDEAIPAMRAAWSGGDVDSELFPAKGHTMLPGPVQSGGPPIWLGGNSQAARRRAVRLGDGWSPIGQSREAARITGTPALESIDSLAADVATVQAARADLGKAPLDIAFAPFEKDLLRQGRTAEFCSGLRRRLSAYEDAGVTWLTIEPASRTFADFRDEVGRLGDLVASQM
jgi:probable F420-dependent oxidoreductase